MKKWIAALVLLAAGIAQGQEFDRTAAVGEYFRTHNAALAEIPFQGNTPRQFSWVRKVTAFDRDGWKCVVCGSTNNLEMDHAVALMNGGANDISNLYALCHVCHVEKTRMDRSLKKHRVGLVKALPSPP
ncbi:MAG: HNH endonuclease [Opitutae bacterium]|nr:HNH endonuclease [Opitutae bacterium]